MNKATIRGSRKLLLLLSLSLAFADAAWSQGAIEDLASVLKTPATIQAAMNEKVGRSVDVLRDVLRQIYSPYTDPKYSDEITRYCEERIAELLAPQIVREASKVYVAALAERLDPTEARKAIEFFSSPVGRRTYSAMKLADSRLSQFLSMHGPQLSEAELASHFAKLAGAQEKRNVR